MPQLVATGGEQILFVCVCVCVLYDVYIAVYVFVGLSGTRHDIIARALLFP
jgi:hypothetical protein